jgi:hypothetical protein
MIFGRLWEESGENGGASEQRSNGARRQVRDIRPAPAPTRVSDEV